MKIKRTYYSNKEESFIPFVKYSYKNVLLENNSYIPRFTIKQEDIIPEMPIGKSFKYSQSLIKLAMEYGMILTISYRGEEDGWKGGRERIIYPMVLGTSKDNNELLRAWHLIGWSISKGKVIEKEWRMLRTDRILSMQFTGGFFRLPPDGYKTTDSGIANINMYANFSKIRANQEKLITKARIQSADDAALSSNKLVYTVSVEDLKYKLDLVNPYESTFIPEKDSTIIRLSFLKNAITNDNIVIVGALGPANSRVKIFENNTLKGTFIVIDSFMANELKNKTAVGGQTVFDMFLYKGKK